MGAIARKNARKKLEILEKFEDYTPADKVITRQADRNLFDRCPYMEDVNQLFTRFYAVVDDNIIDLYGQESVGDQLTARKIFNFQYILVWKRSWDTDKESLVDEWTFYKRRN